ncbi:DUF7455 domain-containing protein [Planosporangium sp. 12N6]|uniref:DUF7455 domain-containing protein n=1 Tax=Planosporangium spinosum TaxID=3402278 RepID=UPI003CF6C174
MAQTLMVSAAAAESTGSTEWCDRCGAAAKLGLVLATGGELTFCGHHANTYADAILAHAESVFLESGFHWRGATYEGAHRAGL